MKGSKTVNGSVRDYLLGLKWDGQSRIYRWLFAYLGAAAWGAEEKQRLAWCGSRWLIDGVRRALTPGCTIDGMLVLCGSQGGRCGSKVFESLGGEFLVQLLPCGLHDKDASLTFGQAWIVQITELELEACFQGPLKQLVSSNLDLVREPYEKFPQVRERCCIFGGSTSGVIEPSRRFWSVQCGSIDVEALLLDRDQLWAEAMDRFCDHLGSQRARAKQLEPVYA